MVVSTDTGISKQRWSVSTLSGNQQFKSKNNETYMLNANTSTWNCDVYTSNNDTYIKFVPIESDRFRLQLASDTTKYLTAEAKTSGANVSWQAFNNASSQIWQFVEVSSPSYTTEFKQLTATISAECTLSYNYQSEWKAIANVVKNRMVYPKEWATTMSGVLSDGQFHGYGSKAYNDMMTWYNNGMPYSVDYAPYYMCLIDAVLAVYNGSEGDNSLGAHFFNKQSTPPYANTIACNVTFSKQHYFYKYK